MTPTLARALSVAHLGLAVLDLEAEGPGGSIYNNVIDGGSRQTKDRGEPDVGPAPAPRAGRETANPFGLPAGGPIRRTLVRFFRRQLARIMGGLPRDPIAEVPAAFDVTDWTDEMTSAMTPVIRPYWDRGGKGLYAEVGLDPKAWKVVSPTLAPKIREQAFHFVSSTNSSTTLRLQAAHAELRQALDEGLVRGGESLPWLTKRVNGIYTGLTKSHAGMIAATEASRAQHAAQLEAAIESEVVVSKSLLLSSDACPRCFAVKAKEPAGGWPLDGTMFDDGGGHEYYSKVPCPPLHPRCQCSMTLRTIYDDPEAGKSLSYPDDIDARIADLEAKYRACRDRRGRFAACGGGGAISQDIRHIAGRDGKPTRPGPHDRETANQVPAAAAWTPTPVDRFRRFDGDDEAGDRRLREAYAGWAASLSDSEREAVRAYSTEDAFNVANALERGDPWDAITARYPGQTRDLTEVEARARNADLDTALRRGSAPEAFVAYRGVDDLRKLGGTGSGSPAVGDMLREGGFASATLRKRIASGHADGLAAGDVPAILEVRIPAGSPGAYLNAGDLSNHAREREFLLPSRMAYRYVGLAGEHRTTTGTAIPIVAVELVP